MATLTRKFYSRYGEAIKHMSYVEDTRVSCSRTLPANEAITVRLESGHGVQVIKLSSEEADALGASLRLHAHQAKARQ